MYASGLALSIAAWVGLLTLLRQGVLKQDYLSRIIYALPWLWLVSLGCYCLGKLGIDLLTFNDYPHEIKALEADIDAARADLASRGFVRAVE